jgi:glycosyltransferase involved in cell wall biosynthesis
MILSYCFTIFTPTYNRAHTLPKVYDSIKAQAFRDFEWVIVDDGSTDETRSLVEHWIAEAVFPIRYFYQQNGHKKVAINHGVRVALGEFFLILDSDDEIPNNALQILHDAWLSIPESQRAQFVGVTGLCVDQLGQLVGTAFPQDFYDSDSISIRYDAKVTGEKWGFNRTDVMRQFPFPEEIKGLVPEALIWNRIAKDYKMRFINQVVRVYHVNEADSISNTNVTRNAEGFRVFYAESLCQEWRRFWSAPIAVMKLAANTVRYDLHCQVETASVTSANCGIGAVWLRLACYPLGYWLSLRDNK